jgi:hypothetical protein
MPTVTLTNTSLRTLTITVDDAVYPVSKATTDISMGETHGTDANSVYVYWWNIGRSKSPQLLAINYDDCTSPTFANVEELNDWLTDACNNVGEDLADSSGKYLVVGINGIDCTEVVPVSSGQIIKTTSDGFGGYKFILE